MPNVQLDIRDERLTKIVSSDAKLESIASGFKFTEGPVWHPTEKHLIFSDITGNSMYRWSEFEGLCEFRWNSHMANGNTYDKQGRLLTCHHASSRVTRTEDNGDLTILASHYDGKELNSPNDIVVKSDGSIYFTDPMSGREPFVGIPRDAQLPFSGVYRIDSETQDLTLLVDDFAKPNGLCFSLDENQLFINDTSRFHIRVFDVNEDGTISNGRIWAETIGEGKGVPDGMKFDSAGNLYCCCPGGIYIFDSEAVCLGVILMPQQVTNFAWGDDDFHSFYITATATVYRIRTNIAGLPVF